MPSTDSDELFIDNDGEEKGKEKQKIENKIKTKNNQTQKQKTKNKDEKKTVNDIHRDIKSFISVNDYSSARLVLNQAFIDGYSGKRLVRWSEFFDSYDTEVKSVLLHPLEDVRITKSNEEKEMIDIDIPDLPDEEETNSEDNSVKDEAGGSVVFGILGGGQAGGRLAESFWKLGYKKAIAINTAEHDLDGLSELPENQKILMTTDSAGGAGKDMQKGEDAADRHQQEIYEKMQKVFGEVDRVLICVGAGGGSGSGACLRLVETAKKYLTYLGKTDVPNRVGVLVTLPTTGEATSPVVSNNTSLLLKKLFHLAESDQLSPLILFDNAKIKKMYPNLTVKQFWPTVNATVTGLFHVFNVLSSQSSDFTSFDPADYQKVLSGGGCMIMGMTNLKDYSDGSDISKAIRSNLEKGLLCGGFDISTAKTAACIATASEAILGTTPGLMNSLETGFDTLANITGNATVFRGIYEVKKDKLTVYTMITGLSVPKKRLKEFEDRSSNQVQKDKLYE